MIVGSVEFKRRLKAVGQSFKPIGRTWADEAVKLARPMVPVRTGKLRASFRVKSATAKRAVVGGWFTAYFIDAGTHYPRSRGGMGRRSRTIFQKQGFRTKPRPFRAYVAHEALRRHPLPDTIVDAWNKAA